MYRDQFGEFVCGYWGLKGKYEKNRPLQGNPKKFGNLGFGFQGLDSWFSVSETWIPDPNR